mmetsp:Transcript_73788/g.139421  ORF Transcript_73788/g.139421 Transcript_73788/m.139421 type:complete len:257 (+) Transcript_73788:642-1412(+)
MRFWLPKSARVTRSRATPNRASGFDPTTFPRTKSLCTSSSPEATDPSAGTTHPVKVDTPTPPVVEPMRRDRATSSTASSPAAFFNPVLVKQRLKSFTSGSSEASRVVKSKPTSAYRIPLEGTSWRSTVAPCSIDTSLGSSSWFGSRSSKPSDGMVASSSGESCLACAAFSFLVSAITVSMSSGLIPALMAASREVSSATCAFSRPESGTISTVTLWALLSSSLRTKSENTGTPLARSAFSSCRGSSNRKPSRGSRS